MPGAPSTPDAEEKRTLTERAADHLRRWIISGELSAGQPLRQVELAQKLGLSRVPLREALRLLEGEGFVVIHPHKGAVVASLTREEIAEIGEVCVLLESELFRRGLPHVTPAVLANARDLVGQMDAASTVAAWARLNWEFHTLFYRLAQRPRMLRLVEVTRRSADAYTYVLLDRPEARAALNADHRAIYEACAAGDHAGAMSRLAAHLGRAIQFASRGIPGGHDAGKSGESAG